MGLEVSFPVTLLCDNSGAIDIADANGSTKRLKHVLTRMAYLQERKDAKSITLVHCVTKGMLADIGTKVLGPQDFHALRALILW